MRMTAGCGVLIFDQKYAQIQKLFVLTWNAAWHLNLLPNNSVRVQLKPAVWNIHIAGIVSVYWNWEISRVSISVESLSISRCLHFCIQVVNYRKWMHCVCLVFTYLHFCFCFLIYTIESFQHDSQTQLLLTSMHCRFGVFFGGVASSLQRHGRQAAAGG